MDACERDLPEPRRDDAVHFPKNHVDRRAPRLASRRRNDAVRARLGAAGLHAQGERGPTRDAGFDRRAATALAVSEALGRRELLAKQRHEARLVVVRHDAKHIRQQTDLIGLARRVASGHDNARARIRPRDSADRLTRALIGRRGHRAGVDHNQIRGVGRRCLGARRAKLLLEAQRVGLIDAAPERYN